MNVVTRSLTVFGNTTSPASELVSTPPYFDGIDDVFRNSFGENTAYPWPKPLFSEIMQINRLRAEAHRSVQSCTASSLEWEVGILRRIRAFSPLAWGNAKASAQATWTLLADVYRDAVTLYCLLSTRHLEHPLQANANTEIRIEMAELLRKNLQEALALPPIQRFVLWPLIVLGVEAAVSSSALRFFVAGELRKMACFTGTHAPLAVLDVLRAAWKSRRKSWDCCFDQSYIFSTHMAIDVSGLK